MIDPEQPALAQLLRYQNLHLHYLGVMFVLHYRVHKHWKNLITNHDSSILNEKYNLTQLSFRYVWDKI